MELHRGFASHSVLHCMSVLGENPVNESDLTHKPRPSAHSFLAHSILQAAVVVVFVVVVICVAVVRVMVAARAHASTYEALVVTVIIFVAQAL